MRILSTLDDKFRPFVSCAEVIWKGVGMEEINDRMKGDELDKQEDTNKAMIYIKDTELDQSLFPPFIQVDNWKGTLKSRKLCL